MTGHIHAPDAEPVSFLHRDSCQQALHPARGPGLLAGKEDQGRAHVA
jgi:hypothetical protein